MSEVRYTEIPEHYYSEYDNWFDYTQLKLDGYNDFMQAAEQHPVYFAYWLCGIKFRNYQVFLMDMMMKNQYVYFVISRRLGKSTMFKVFAAWALWYNKFPQGIEDTTKVVVMAHTQDGADSYISDVRAIFERGDKRIEILTKGKTKNFFTSKFPRKMDNAKNNTEEFNICRRPDKHGWCSIKSYPPTVRARGIPASIMLLDEVASWYKNCDETEVYYEVVRPIPTDSPDTRIFGATTPKGEAGLSYNLMDIDGHDTIYKLIWLPYFVRKDQQYLDNMSKVEKEYKSQGMYQKFRQEFLAELIGVDDLYFTDTEINNVFSQEKNISMHIDFDKEVDLGLDFGGSRRSRTVVTLSYFDKENNMIYRIYHYRYPLAEDATLQQDLIAINKKFKIRKFHLDNQGGGSAFYAWARNYFGSDKLDEVNFKAEKQKMYRLAKIACFQGRVLSYYDRDLRTEFYSFNTSLKPDGSETDDLLDSFFMSCKDWLELDKPNNQYKIFNDMNKYLIVKNNGIKKGILQV